MLSVATNRSRKTGSAQRIKISPVLEPLGDRAPRLPDAEVDIAHENDIGYRPGLPKALSLLVNAQLPADILLVCLAIVERSFLVFSRSSADPAQNPDCRLSIKRVASMAKDPGLQTPSFG